MYIYIYTYPLHYVYFNRKHRPENVFRVFVEGEGLDWADWTVNSSPKHGAESLSNETEACHFKEFVYLGMTLCHDGVDLHDQRYGFV